VGNSLNCVSDHFKGGITERVRAGGPEIFLRIRDEIIAPAKDSCIFHPPGFFLGLPGLERFRLDLKVINSI
jgi:hypothetical protein